MKPATPVIPIFMKVGHVRAAPGGSLRFLSQLKHFNPVIVPLITRAACFTFNSFVLLFSREAELNSTTAHPTTSACGVAEDKRIIRDITRDNSTSSNECVSPDRHTAHNRTICSSSGTLLYQCPLVLPFAS